MDIPFLDLSHQFRSIEAELRIAMDRVLKGGRYILGAECDAFEEEFAAFTGAKHCVAVGSGTDALTIALRAAGISPGDEVITAANTCPPTAAAIVNTGAQLTLGDIGAHAPHLSANAIPNNARAIVPVHLYGIPCPMQPIIDAASNAIIIEDCAQAHGAAVGGRHCGTFGHAGAYSFYPTKNLGAMGDGGAIVTNSEGLADEARAMRNYGARDRYEATGPGYNSRLDELQCAILRTKLKRLPAWIEARRERAKRYDEKLPSEVCYSRGIDSENDAFHLYVIRTKQRDALRPYLAGRGIGTEIHYPIPLNDQPAYCGAKLADNLSNARAHCNEVLSLPLYPELPIDHVDRVAEAVAEFFA